MLRLPAYLVMIALLATPLALVARGIACNPSECDCMAMCARQGAERDLRLCGTTKHAPMCETHRGNHALDYGFIAPIAPTPPLTSVQLEGPTTSNEFVTEYAQSGVTRSLSEPFEPPRS